MPAIGQINQGHRANESGLAFEAETERVLTNAGFQIVPFRAWQTVDHSDYDGVRLAVTNAPYRGPYPR